MLINLNNTYYKVYGMFQEALNACELAIKMLKEGKQPPEWWNILITDYNTLGVDDYKKILMCVTWKEETKTISIEPETLERIQRFVIEYRKWLEEK